MRWPLSFALLLLAAPVAAQSPTFIPSPLTPTCKIQWEHAGVDVQRWEIKVDGALWTSASAATPSGTTWTVSPCPTLSVGAHTLTVAACNVAGCATSPVFAFRLVVVPTAPSNARISGGA